MTRPARSQRQPSPPLDPAAPDALGEHAGVAFQRERLKGLIFEIGPLIERDWRENGVDHERVPLKLNWREYLGYDLLGILQIVTARDDGVLVGFVFNFLHPHIMHANTRWAIIDLYWLYPEYRGQGIGRAMMEANLRFLKSAKTTVVQGSSKVEHEHGLWTRLGFKPTDTAYRLLLED